MKFFQAIQDLTRSPFLDTHDKALEALYKILQSSGQVSLWAIHSVIWFKVLQEGWQPVLDILATEAQDNGKTLSTAFTSIQLINTDFLHLLPIGTIFSDFSFHALQSIWECTYLL